MNFLIYIIIGVIFVVSLVLLQLHDKLPRFCLNDGIHNLVSITYIVSIFCIIILAIFSIELIPYMIHRDNIKNVNQYESVIYELEHPEEFREIDRIHDATDWNSKYDSYIYSHDHNILCGILYPLGDMEGTEHIDVEKYLGE